MDTQAWKNNVGFTFALEDRPDGTPYVKVIDPWYNQAEPGLQPAMSLTIKLRPYASYSEAREIANFINSRMSYGNLPLIELQATGS